MARSSSVPSVATIWMPGLAARAFLIPAMRSLRLEAPSWPVTTATLPLPPSALAIDWPMVSPAAELMVPMYMLRPLLLLSESKVRTLMPAAMACLMTPSTDFGSLTEMAIPSTCLAIRSSTILTCVAPWVFWGAIHMYWTPAALAAAAAPVLQSSKKGTATFGMTATTMSLASLARASPAIRIGSAASTTFHSLFTALI